MAVSRVRRIIVDSGIAIYALAVIFLFLIDIDAIPKHITVCTQRPYPYQDECTTYYVLTFVVRRAGMLFDIYSGTVTALATAIMAFFTARLWISTNRQWRSSQDLLKLSREEFISSHRPKIRVKHLWLEKGLNSDDPLTAALVIVNRGETNAVVDEFKFRFFVGGTKGERLPDKLLDIPPMNVGTAPLQSGGVWQIGPLSGEVLPDVMKGHIASGRRILYAVGDIQYRDDLKVAKKTAFCRYWESGRFLPMDHPDPDYDYED